MEHKEPLVEQLNALGQDTRMGIVRALCEEGELSFGDIAARVQLFQGLYYHLKMLKETGILKTRKVDSKRVVYYVSVKTLYALCASVTRLIRTREELDVVKQTARSHF